MKFFRTVSTSHLYGVPLDCSSVLKVSKASRTKQGKIPFTSISEKQPVLKTIIEKV